MLRLLHYISRSCYRILFFRDSGYNHRLEKIAFFYYKISKKGNGIHLGENRRRRVIVSLTTIPERISNVYLVVESLLRQVYKPDRIILWLATDEFQDIHIPPELERQKKRGLEIRYCDNLYSHKKYYYSMKYFPNDLLITVDDDILYSECLVKNLVKTYTKYPGNIVCCRSHYITYYDRVHHKIRRYNDWEGYENRKKISYGPDKRQFFTSGSGVLFPIWKMPSVCLEKSLFLKLCPTADDVWLNFMARLGHMGIINIQSCDGFFISIEESQGKSLADINLSNNLMNNDRQIVLMQNYFNLFL